MSRSFHLPSVGAACLASLLAFAPGAVAQTSTIPVGEYRLLRIDGSTAVLRMVNNKLELLDGDGLFPRWARGLTADDQPGLAKYRTEDNDPTTTLRFVRRIARDCPDLNGDGKGDLVLGLDFEPDLVAVDGTNGDVLWWHRNRPRPAGTQFAVAGGDSFVLSDPLQFDVDGDGTPDLVTGFSCAAYSLMTPAGKKEEMPAETLVQAVSGRTGKPLWSRHVADGGFDRPSLPDKFIDYFQVLGTWKGEPTVTVVARGDAWTLKLRTGEPVGPAVKPAGLTFNVGGHQERARFFDPDGNGELAVVLLSPGGEPIKHGDDQPTPNLKVSAVRAATGEVLWEATQEGLKTDWRPMSESDQAAACDWPLPVAFEGGKQDLVLPFLQWQPGHIGRSYWHGLERRDGRTGHSVWRRRLLVEEPDTRDKVAVPRLLAGPDLTGDGCADLFAVQEVEDHKRWEAHKAWVSTGFPKKDFVTVTALSGKDGGLLWQRVLPEGMKEAATVGRPSLEPAAWWRSAEGVRAQLVIPRSDNFDGEGCHVWVVEPATGFVRAALGGMEWVAPVDGKGLVLGHVPGSWNPRRTPDEGRLVQWRPGLEADLDEAGNLPAGGAAVTLPVRPAFPWQERPLPWAATRSLWWEVGAGVFVVLLVVLLVRRHFRSAFGFLFLVVLLSVAISYWQVHADAAAMDPEEHYVFGNWYGIAPITASAFVPLMALWTVALATVGPKGRRRVAAAKQDATGTSSAG
jgi:hypothetical protein